MSTRVVAVEFAKMRRLRIVLFTALLVAIVFGLSVMSAVTNPDFANPSQRSWEVLLGGMSLAVPLASPFLLAVLASRLVEIEHQGNGWLLSQTSGFTPGELCRVKLFTVGTLVAIATVLESALVIGAGLLLGVTAPLPGSLWFSYTVSILAINLVTLAMHILLSARIENQLVGPGIGILGTLVAVFATGLPNWLAHATPWGYYALIAAADYREGILVQLTPAYSSVIALSGASVVLFLLITGLFDRQEV